MRRAPSPPFGSSIARRFSARAAATLSSSRDAHVGTECACTPTTVEDLLRRRRRRRRGRGWERSVAQRTGRSKRERERCGRRVVSYRCERLGAELMTPLALDGGCEASRGRQGNGIRCVRSNRQRLGEAARRPRADLRGSSDRWIADAEMLVLLWDEVDRERKGCGWGWGRLTQWRS